MKLRFENKRVVVVGDLILDRYVEGKVRRISPEAPVPVVELLTEEHKPGGAANVAVLLKYLGADVALVGVIGDDEDGRILLELLKDKGVKTSFIVKEKERPTTVKTRVISKSHHIVRLDRESTHHISPDTQKLVISMLKKLQNDFDAILIEDYDKGFVTPEMIKGLKSLGMPVYVDPKIKNMSYYTNIRLLKPNLKEFIESTGYRLIEDHNELYERAHEFKVSQNVEILLVTLGERGMLMLCDGKILRIPAIRREVYDVTGAGDMVIAAFTISDLSGYTPIESALISSIAAGIEVTKLGATPVTPEEIKVVLKEEFEDLRSSVECIYC